MKKSMISKLDMTGFKLILANGYWRHINHDRKLATPGWKNRIYAIQNARRGYTSSPSALIAMGQRYKQLFGPAEDKEDKLGKLETAIAELRDYVKNIKRDADNEYDGDDNDAYCPICGGGLILDIGEENKNHAINYSRNTSRLKTTDRLSIFTVQCLGTGAVANVTFSKPESRSDNDDEDDYYEDKPPKAAPKKRAIPTGRLEDSYNRPGKMNYPNRAG